MNTTPESRLLELYDRVAEAPDSLERLRKFVLDLAVRGKLVEQDPEDEPAEELLERIATEKERLVKTGAIRKTQAVSSLDPEDIAYPAPDGWVWSQIAQIGVISPRNDAADGLDASFVSMPMISAELGVPHQHEVRPWGEIKKGYTHFAEGDVGLAKITPCFENGKSTVFRNLTGGIGAGTTELQIVRPILVNADYVLLFLKSPQFIETGIPRMTGTAGQKRVPKEYFTSAPFPLSPLPEQHRIVTKVDELMALLDRLETTRTQRETTRDRLTTASLTRLTAPDTAEKEFPSHARFALDNLEQLTSRSDQLKVLRQTILNLAVRGKLVQQDSGDEPASELLRRIAQAKAAAKQDSGDRRIKQTPTPNPDTLPIYLPAGWSVQSFENLFLFIDYRGKTPPKTTDGVPLITAKNVRMGSLNREPREFVSQKTFDNWMTRGLPQLGDLFFTTEAPLANICLNNITEPFALAQRVICFQPYGEISTRYLMFAVMSDVMQDLISEYSTGLTAKGIKAAKLKPLPLPIPPLNEQHRIEARIDALMDLCDRMETSLTNVDITSVHLFETLLAKSLPQQSDRKETFVAGVRDRSACY